MSIITDALRKAEEERELKTKRPVETVLAQADFEQAELLKRFGYTKSGKEVAALSTGSIRVQKPSVNLFVSVLQKTLISISLVTVCFFVVYLGPRWLINPGSFSEDMSLIKNDTSSKINFLITSISERISSFSGPEVALMPSQEPEKKVSVLSAPVSEEVQEAPPIPTVEIQPVPALSVPVVAQGPERSYVLSGISVMGNDRYAVINGSIVQKGDSIEGAYVKDILDREVVLETRSAEIKLKIPA